MLEVMPEVMSAETALIKWSEVFFLIVYDLKLDGVGPVDNRPSTDQLHHFV